MLVNESKGISICALFNGEIITLDDSLEWSVWLKNVRDVADNTRRTFMKSMERFWIWSLYNPVAYDEKFPSYQARYREALREGFKITEIIKDEELGDELEVEISSCSPLQKITINKEIAGINSYFYFTEEHDLLYDHRFINHLYEKQRSAKSFLSSIQIKKSTLALEAFGQKIKYLPPYKIPKNNQTEKWFPMELFDTLLEVSKPRERLIFLLCGACSARIGQALNLTLYDIDYENQEVWLLDPKSDNIDIYGNKRRVWLNEEYQIDMSQENNEHNTPDLQFKYPIPFSHGPLFWINEAKYRTLFFETLQAYQKSDTYMPEMIRDPRHPFLFTTKSGKRVHARETLSRLKSSIRKAVKKMSYKKDISDLGMHSLRHMFGHAMAEIYARVGDDSLISITKDAMGHANMDSTMIYFNISSDTKRATIRRLTKDIHSKSMIDA